MIQDKEGNEFVWVPVDSVSTGTSKPADDIRLGRYTFDTTKGTPTKQQDADSYTEIVIISPYHQELTSNSGNTAAKSLEDFVTKTKANGGYYLGRYEASQGSDGKVDSQANKAPWVSITQPNVAINVKSMYSSNYIESDLINSYSWDTATVFIQKYSGYSNYANKSSVNTRKLNTGVSGDKVCNIYDMSSNCLEWSTEHSTLSNNPCVTRGGDYNTSAYITSSRTYCHTVYKTTTISFRPLLYVK